MKKYHYKILVYLILVCALTITKIDTIDAQDTLLTMYLDGDEYILQTSDTNSQGFATGNSLFQVTGDLNYIFRHLNTIDSVKFFFNDSKLLGKKFSLKINYANQFKTPTKKDLVKLHTKVSDTFECEVKNFPSEITGYHLLYNSKALKKKRNGKIDQGVVSKITSDRTQWSALNISMNDLASYLSDYYGKIFTTKDKKDLKFSITMDKSMSLMEAIAFIEAELGLLINEQIFRVTNYESSNCYSE